MYGVNDGTSLLSVVNYTTNVLCNKVLVREYRTSIISRGKKECYLILVPVQSGNLKGYEHVFVYIFNISWLLHVS